jgi:hypothetical protein
MKASRKTRRMHSESGIALLIAIFVLMLISAVAISLVVSSGTESSLAGNYRTTLNARFAATAGIEEARGRLVPSNPSPIALPLVGAPAYLPANQVVYITNPAAGEPAGAALMALYPDTEFDQEFTGAPTLAAATKTYVNSIWTGAVNNGPLYKWVRINAATKKSLGINVDNTGLAAANASIPLYYDTGLIPASIVIPPAVGNVPGPVLPATQRQIYEITALAVLPNGSQKRLQYVVTPVNFGLNFQGALTLGGQVGNFNGANSNQYKINGTDGSGSAALPAGCAIPNPPSVNAGIAVSPGLDTGNGTGLTNQQYVTNSLPRPDHYLGSGGTPSVVSVVNNGALSTPDSLDQLVQQLKASADVVMGPNPPVGPTYNNSGTTYNFGQSGPGYTWPSNMSASNPKVIFADGSFDLGPNTGYGILVVTGNFTYHGNSGWNGIILVIGDGTTTFLGNGGGNGEFDGAIFAATTRDASGNQLPNYGNVNFDINGGGGNGIYYNSCWINRVQQPPSYQILSFQER